MEDEEECDELPPITVNSSGRDSSAFAMPCAVEVAAARAREQRAERELAALREQHAPALLHSDSSGSEGEAALAAAAGGLRLRGPARAAPPRLAALLPRAAARLPAPAAAALLRLARAAPRAPLRAALRRAQAWLASPGRAVDEQCAVGAWLCLAAVSAERAALGPAVTRAAQCLLDEGEGAARALEPALLAAAPEPRLRLRLADALRSGGEHSDALAERLARAALADLLQLAPDAAPEEWEAGAARWRRLPAADQYAALQLAARLRAWAEPGAGLDAPGTGPARLLAAVTAAPPPPARDHTPDTLKVLVAATKMRVLFPAKK